MSDTILIVPPNGLAVLAGGGLEFVVERVIRLEVDGGGEIGAIASVVAKRCRRFALRLGDQVLGCGDSKMCTTLSSGPDAP